MRAGSNPDDRIARRSNNDRLASAATVSLLGSTPATAGRADTSLPRPAQLSKDVPRCWTLAPLTGADAASALHEQIIA